MATALPADEHTSADITADFRQMEHEQNASHHRCINIRQKPAWSISSQAQEAAQRCSLSADDDGTHWEELSGPLLQRPLLGSLYSGWRMPKQIHEGSQFLHQQLIFNALHILHIAQIFPQLAKPSMQMT